MNDIPPKQAPDASSGNLVAMYQAAGSNSESFPVLKAFQDYIDAERAQARKRVMILSISFSAVLCAVVICFLGMGVYLLKDMSSVQNKLIDAALAQRNAPAPVAPVQQPQQAPIVVQAPTPPAPAPSPANDSALLAVSKELADLRSELEKKKNEEARQAAMVVQKQAEAQLAELQKLQKEMGSIKKENQMLKESFVMSRKPHQPEKPVVVAPPPAPVQIPPTPVSVQVTPPPAPEVKEPAPDALAVAAVEPEKTVIPEKAVVTEAGFPPATKEPPVTPPGVKAEEPKKGTMATAIPLKTKNLGSVPWRVIIPE
jgi:hypothetical protein